MFITFTRTRGCDAYHSYGFGVPVVVADRPGASRPLSWTRKVRLPAFPILCRRCTPVRRRSRSGSLGAQDDPLGGKDGSGTREGGPVQERRRSVWASDN